MVGVTSASKIHISDWKVEAGHQVPDQAGPQVHDQGDPQVRGQPGLQVGDHRPHKDNRQ